MYCVEWKTRNAKPAKKSLEDSNPATGRSVNPVQSFEKKKKLIQTMQRTKKNCHLSRNWRRPQVEECCPLGNRNSLSVMETRDYAPCRRESDTKWSVVGRPCPRWQSPLRSSQRAAVFVRACNCMQYQRSTSCVVCKLRQ